MISFEACFFVLRVSICLRFSLGFSLGCVSYREARVSRQALLSHTFRWVASAWRRPGRRSSTTSSSTWTWATAWAISKERIESVQVRFNFPCPGEAPGCVGIVFCSGEPRSDSGGAGRGGGARNCFVATPSAHSPLFRGRHADAQARREQGRGLLHRRLPLPLQRGRAPSPPALATSCLLLPPLGATCAWW